MKKEDPKSVLQKQEEKKFETNILEQTIIKIGALLALGFGEAGSEIIAKNLKKGRECTSIKEKLCSFNILSSFQF